MKRPSFKRALVTGGAGFIGSHIAELLLRQGLEVTVLDDLSTGSVLNIPPGARFYQGSLLEDAILRESLSGVDVVFHNAARVSIRNSFDGAREDAETNILGTIELLKESGRAKIRKFIFASSMAVYDGDAEVPIHEERRLLPVSPYGCSKYSGELYTALLSGHMGFDSIVLRYFNTFGPRQAFTPYVGVVTIFITNLLKGKPPVIFGDGRQTRDFVHVGDVAAANVLAMESDIRHGVFNIGSGKGTSVNEVAGMLIERLSPGVRPVYAPPQPGEPRDSVADITEAGKKLGFKPRFTLRDKIDEVIGWCRQTTAEA